MKRLYAVVLPLLLLGVAGSDSDRVFTVRDSIEMVHFLPDPHDCGASPMKVAFSPDNHYFAVVTSQGVIRSNAIASTISVFSTEAVQDYLRGGKIPQPHIIARVTAVPHTNYGCSYEPMIFALQWLANSHGVLFTAEGAAANERRLYEADLASGSMHAVSPQGYDVEKFVVARDSLVYQAAPPRTVHPVGERINPDAIDITGQAWYSVLFPQLYTDNESPDTLWVIRNGMNRRIGDSAHPLQLVDTDDVLSVSPTGNALVTLLPVQQIPPSWAAFEPDPQQPYRRLKPGGDPARMPTSWGPLIYALVDLATGKIQPLIQAPNAGNLGSDHHSGAAWSPSERAILVMNTFLPLEGIDASERAQRRYPCIAAVVDVQTSQIQCLAFDAYTYDTKGPLLQDGTFGKNDDEIILHMKELPDQTYTDEQYHFENGEWRLVQSTMSRANGSPPSVGSLSVTIRQSLNVPPALWATDLHSGITQKLLDPNPQLAHMHFGEESILRWKDSSGFEWVAGLVKPPGYVKGKRYPLVIQTHGFFLNDFMTDGSFTTAFAARELAGAGMMVLQINQNAEHFVSSQEVSDQLRGFESAIAHLDAMGLIDPKRVGIIGFSRTSYHVEGALIADPQLFAAASITDGVDESYMDYMLSYKGLGLPYYSEEDLIYGTPPFGKGLAVWAKNAPGFQLDRVRTPLLIGTLSPAPILGEWEIYASLRMQKKPVDLMYLPQRDGYQHILQRPLDRLASQQTNVDWFRFWLQRYEDPDPAKVAQYKRWEGLRKLQEAEKS